VQPTPHIGELCPVAGSERTPALARASRLGRGVDLSGGHVGRV